MSTIQDPQMACKGKNVSDEDRRWVFSRMPQMGALLDKLDAGETPNFLDILTAISNLVAFATECDPNPNQLQEKNISMSGNNCRFCS